MLRRELIYLFVAVCSLSAVTDCAIPSFLKTCYRNDPKLAKCITNSINHLLPYLKVGIPKYEIPAIEPFYVNNVKLNTGTQAARVYANLTDIRVWNASTFNIQEIIPNVKKNSYRFKVRIPYLRMEGKYEVDTKILFLEVRGKGPFHINVTNYFFDCTLKGNKVSQQGVEHLLFEQMKCEIAFETAKFRMENVFGNNPTLSQATNDIINDNLDAFYTAIKPNLIEAITSKFTEISNKITTNFDYNEVFPLK